MTYALHIAQASLMAGVATLLMALAVRRREWRGGFMAMGFIFLGVAINELDPFWKRLSLLDLDEPEILPIAASLVLAGICALRWRGSTWGAFGEVLHNRRFFLLAWGLLFVSLLPNVVRNRHLWQLLAPVVSDTRMLRDFAQEMTKAFGHFLLVNWIVLFLKDEWRRLVHQLSPHEHLLHEQPLIEIGQGARRICYRLGETGFCVKFLRDPSDTRSERKLGWRFRQMLKNGRFDRRLNVNCLEAEAMEKYRHEAGPLVAAAFPEVVEVVFDERRGYGVLMSLVTNADGSLVVRTEYEMKKRGDTAFAARCCQQLEALLKELADASAPFFEPRNVQIQFLADGSTRLRLIDFEPVDKKLIPLTEVFPFMRRQNLQRKARAYLQDLRAEYGLP